MLPPSPINYLREITSDLVGEKISISLLEGAETKYIKVGNELNNALTTTPSKEEAGVFSVGYTGGNEPDKKIYLRSGADRYAFSDFVHMGPLKGWVIGNTNAGIMGNYKAFLSHTRDGTVIFQDTVTRDGLNAYTGSYWSFFRMPDTGMTHYNFIRLIQPASLLPAMKFNVHVHKQEAIFAPPFITPCEIAEGKLIWQITGAFILALSIGPIVINSEVNTGIVGLIKTNAKASEALAVLLKAANAVKADKVAVFTLVSKFLEVLYHQGVLWSVIKFVLNAAGYWIAFRVLSKLIEVVLAPEVEAADLSASFLLWAYQFEQAFTEYRLVCK